MAGDELSEADRGLWERRSFLYDKWLKEEQFKKVVDDIEDFEDINPKQHLTIWQQKIVALDSSNQNDDAVAAVQILKADVPDYASKIKLLRPCVASILGRLAFEGAEYAEAWDMYSHAWEVSKSNNDREKADEYQAKSLEAEQCLMKQFEDPKVAKPEAGGKRKKYTVPLEPATSKIETGTIVQIHESEALIETTSEALIETIVEVPDSTTPEAVIETIVEVPESTTPEAVIETIVEVSFTVNHLIGSHIKEGVYEGRIKSCHFDYKKSFVEQLPSFQITQKLRELSCDHLVKVDYTIDSDQTHNLLMIDDLVPLEYYFEFQLELFKKADIQEDKKAKWWLHICDCFTNIFRDVVHGLMYLDSLDIACSDRFIFVSKNGRGKILPSCDTKDQSQVVKQLISTMQDILTLPFPDQVIDDSFGIPLELKRLLAFVSSEKLAYLPGYWLYNHPFFWSTEERIVFIKDMRCFMKEGIFNSTVLGAAIGQCLKLKDWSLTINDPLFILILNYPLIKPYRLGEAIEIVRYMTAGYNHVNDTYYDLDRPPHKKFTQAEIEDYFRSFFPSIYVDLFEALYHCAKHDLKSSSASSSQNPPCYGAFRKWSRTYLAVEVSPTSKARAEEVFKSIHISKKAI